MQDNEHGPEHGPDPKGDETIVEVVATDAGQAEAAEPGITEEIKAQLAEAQRKAADAERRLAEEQERNAQAKRTVTAELTDSRLQTIASALDVTAAKIKEVQAKRRAALEAGEWDAEAAASDELMALKVKQSRLDEGKTALEQEIEQSRQAPADPVERYVHNMTPRAQAWVRSHREVVTDPSRNAALERAHYRALGAGIREGSEDYFAHMDREMGYASPAQEARAEPEGGHERRAPAPPAPPAPPSRDVPSPGTGQSRTTVRLSAAEREAADMAGMSYVDYARERDRLRSNGQFITH